MHLNVTEAFTLTKGGMLQPIFVLLPFHFEVLRIRSERAENANESMAALSLSFVSMELETVLQGGNSAPDDMFHGALVDCCLLVLRRATIRRAAANLKFVDILPQEGLNVYSILERDHLVLTACCSRCYCRASHPDPSERKPLDIKPSMA